MSRIWLLIPCEISPRNHKTINKIKKIIFLIQILVGDSTKIDREKLFQRSANSSGWIKGLFLIISPSTSDFIFFECCFSSPSLFPFSFFLLFSLFFSQFASDYSTKNLSLKPNTNTNLDLSYYHRRLWQSSLQKST